MNDSYHLHHKKMSSWTLIPFPLVPHPPREDLDVGHANVKGNNQHVTLISSKHPVDN